MAEPDFGSLYGQDPDLTPTAAAVLWITATMLYDEYRDPRKWDLLLEELPPVVRNGAGS